MSRFATGSRFYDILLSSTTTSNSGRFVCAKSDSPGATVLKNAFDRIGGSFPLFLGGGLLAWGGNVSSDCCLVEEESTCEPAEGVESFGTAAEDLFSGKASEDVVCADASEGVVTFIAVALFLPCGGEAVFLEVDASCWRG